MILNFQKRQIKIVKNIIQDLKIFKIETVEEKDFSGIQTETICIFEFCWKMF